MTTIERETGTEGPRHDPYSYTEWEMQLADGRSITVHVGLSEWVRIPSGRAVHCNDSLTVDDVLMTLRWPVDLRGIERAFEAYREHELRAHRKCGGTQSTTGYPGEHFVFCKCGAVLDYHFNLSEVE